MLLPVFNPLSPVRWRRHHPAVAAGFRGVVEAVAEAVEVEPGSGPGPPTVLM